MSTTIFIAKVIGPLLIVRALSLLLHKKHFLDIVNRLEKDVDSIMFAMMEVLLFGGFLTLLLVHFDWSNIAASLITLTAIGGLVKSTMLMLFPNVIVKKAKLLVEAGYLNIVFTSTTAVGLYLTWFGYFS